MHQEDSRLNVAVVAFNRPLTLRNLLSQFHQNQIASVNFFFDYPMNWSTTQSGYRQALKIARTWASNSKIQTTFHIATTHLGGNKNTLMAISYLADNFKEGLLCEDDSDLHPSYLEFLQVNRAHMRVNQGSEGLYGISPFLLTPQRDLYNLRKHSVSLMLNSLMGGTLGLYVTRQLAEDFYNTHQNLENRQQIVHLIEAIRALPLNLSMKSAFAHRFVGKYIRYEKSWHGAIPESKKGIPSWDGLLMSSILINGRKILTPEFSLVREYPKARDEGSWHLATPKHFDWSNLSGALTISVSCDPEGLSKLVKDQVQYFISDTSPAQRLQGLVLLVLPPKMKRPFLNLIRILNRLIN